MGISERSDRSLQNFEHKKTEWQRQLSDIEAKLEAKSYTAYASLLRAIKTAKEYRQKLGLPYESYQAYIDAFRQNN
jgi:hypothetical protein